MRTLAMILLVLVAAGASAQVAFFSAPQQSRGVSYEMSGPLGHPIFHATTFNGIRILPSETGTVYRVRAQTLGSGRGVAGSAPVVGGNRDRLVIASQWIEDVTGESFEATLDLTHPEDQRVIVEILTDGLINVYVAGEDLRAGGLGRPAIRSDYDLIATACGSPLPADAENRVFLEQARDGRFGIEPSHFEGRSFPVPAPNRCTGT